jgi:hypothetical protein
MEIKVGQRYKHWKGNVYTVIALARNSDTLDEEVIYQGEYSDSEFGENPVWTRSLAEFVERVEVEGRVTPRFQLLE